MTPPAELHSWSPLVIFMNGLEFTAAPRNPADVPGEAFPAAPLLQGRLEAVGNAGPSFEINARLALAPPARAPTAGLKFVNNRSAVASQNCAGTAALGHA